MSSRGKIAPRQRIDAQKLAQQVSDESMDETSGEEEEEGGQSPSRALAGKAPRQPIGGKSCKRARSDSGPEEEDAEASGEEDGAPSADEESEEGGEQSEEGGEESEEGGEEREAQTTVSQQLQMLRTDNYDQAQCIKELESENKRLTLAEAVFKREITRLRAKCGEGASEAAFEVEHCRVRPDGERAARLRLGSSCERGNHK